MLLVLLQDIKTLSTALGRDEQAGILPPLAVICKTELTTSNQMLCSPISQLCVNKSRKRIREEFGGGSVAIILCRINLSTDCVIDDT